MGTKADKSLINLCHTCEMFKHFLQNASGNYMKKKVNKEKKI